MKVLSLDQPWASLVAVGVKWIETRSWSTRHRGRLLIHATRRWPIPEEGAAALAAWARVTTSNELPLGAVVASCVLTDVVPIGGEHWFRSADWQGDEQEHQDQTVIVACDGSYNRPRLCLDTPGERLRDVSEQEPFGDFSPGRFAWLLGDVKPTTERCPRCWGDCKVEFDGPNAPTGWVPCPTCRGPRVNGNPGVPMGACEPVPMRGRQRMFEPVWPLTEETR